MVTGTTHNGDAQAVQARLDLVTAYNDAARTADLPFANPDGDGFITIYSCGTRDEVSSLNYRAGQTVSNAVLAPVSATGTICLYSPTPTDVVIDINSWFTNVP